MVPALRSILERWTDEILLPTLKYDILASPFDIWQLGWEFLA